jgi:hypothetical protein
LVSGRPTDLQSGHLIFVPEQRFVLLPNLPVEHLQQLHNRDQADREPDLWPTFEQALALVSPLLLPELLPVRVLLRARAAIQPPPKYYQL